MTIKDKIYQAIKTMERDELILLYEQIQLIIHLKHKKQPRNNMVAIEDILEMTSTSQENWSDAVIEERSERI